MFGWQAVAAFFAGKKGPYGVALAAFVLVGYLAYIDIPTMKLGIVTAFAGCVCVVYFLRNREEGRGTTKLYLQFGNKEPIHISEDTTMAIVAEITADQYLPILGFKAVDRNGETVTVTPEPVLSVVTEGAFEIVEVEGVKKLRSLKSGLCQFKVASDPDTTVEGEEGETIGYFEVNAVPGVAKTIEPILGAIEPIPEG